MGWIKKLKEPPKSHYCHTPDALGFLGIFGGYPAVGSQWSCDICNTLWTMELESTGPNSSVQGWCTKNINAKDARILRSMDM